MWVASLPSQPNLHHIKGQVQCIQLVAERQWEAVRKRCSAVIGI